MINTKDTADRGIANGDVVHLFNSRGQALAAAVVMDNITQGTVVLHEGAWYDPQESGEIGTFDKEGSPNTLTLDVPLTSGYAQATIAETAIVQVEKYAEAAPKMTAYTSPEA
ncbi:molybdopterin dinucleotide binding domain-containing protein [Breoghania sp.]|uniref:molybdopterin dinucleotide binding domain-containing protein n=1 Tax=Breoghania sp. TaxID=2065378 RepID=UPI0026242F8C|nr:molybdopterin dinucleotide binding domain-containing protein [Breoghania sp.]MDJ0932835.1 molybdopterin dinucleotide binding domain-containing protein [Breoghania sp.]